MNKVKTREYFLLLVKEYLPNNFRSAEIGVLNGDFSAEILRILKPEVLFLIDPYSVSETKYDEGLNNLTTAYSTEDDYQKLLKRFEKEIASGQVCVIRKFSYEIVKDFSDKSLDFIYIDADHTYFAVKKDLNDWFPKLKENGVMAGHDYIPHQSFGVVQAVDEFCAEHNFEMIVLNEGGGDFALKRKVC